MTATTPAPDPAQAKPLVDEADIGSGEKPPSQIETEEMIRQIPPLPPSDGNDSGASATAQVDGGENREQPERDASVNPDAPSAQPGQRDPAPSKD